MTKMKTVLQLLQRALVRVLRILFLLAVVMGIGVGVLYTWVHITVLSTLPKDIKELRWYRPQSSCQVYAANGALLDEFYVERRIWVPLDELPPHVWQAFVAAEDRRFFKHPGVDVIGMGRALVANVLEGTIVQGGSTLTQQLVKNIVVGRERSYERKLKEVVLAWRLERELKKAEILELYINYVYLGSGNHGVEAAAQDYFGVSARELDAGQAALLGGLVRAPSRYSPRVDASLAAARRKIVLSAMVEEGYVDGSQAAQFLDDPIVKPRASKLGGNLASAYRTQVRREIHRLLGDELPFKLGFQVRTALDVAVQAVAESAVRQALHDMESRQGRLGAVRRLPRAQWASFLARAPGLQRQADGTPLPPGADQCFEALVGESRALETLRAGQWTFSLRQEDWDVPVHTPALEPVAPVPLRQQLDVGDVLRVCLMQGHQVRLDPRPWAEGAAIVLENRTGRVLALVGGYDVELEGFVRATQARRQPGSSFKPFVYATALLHGRTQLDALLDAPLALPAGGGRIWSPGNYDGRFVGKVSLRTALARSINTASVRLALELGPAEIARVARTMGVRSPLRHDVTLALGSSEVTLMDQVLGFATIARMGITAAPVYIDDLSDAWGNHLASAGEPVKVDGQVRTILPGGPGPRALPAGVAYELADMLREVVQTGTARRAYDARHDRAGKTGTTNNFVDAWFIGFTPRYTVGVWMGSDGSMSLGEDESGGRAALPAWLQIVSALAQPEGERFPLPDEAVLLPHLDRWVALPRGNVPFDMLPVVEPQLGAPLPRVAQLP